MNKLETIIKLQDELQQEITDLQDELYNIQKAIKRANIMSNILSSGYFDKYKKNDTEVIEKFENAKESYSIILEYIERSYRLINDLMNK